MIAPILLVRIALLSAALWLIGHVARRERLAVRRSTALLSLVLLFCAAPASLWLQQGVWNVEAGWSANTETAVIATPVTALNWIEIAAWILSAVYLAGVGVGLTRFGLGLFRLLRMRVYSAPAQGQRLLRQVAPPPNRPRLYISRDCRLPFSTQFWPGSRGRIVLPAGMLGSADRDTLTAILRHEYRHLAGNDPWWSLLSRLLCALFWPVPFVHALNRQLDEIQEAEADQAAVAGQSLPQKALYAECLIALASRPGLARPVAVVCGAVGRSFQSLEGRIRSILAGADQAEQSGRRAAVRRRLCNGITALVVLALPVIFVIGVTPSAASPRSQPATGRAPRGAELPATLEEQEAALRIPIRMETPPAESLTTGTGELLTEELRLRAGL